MYLLSSFFRCATPIIRHSVPSICRARGDLAPRRTKYKKAHKGRIPLPIGGSTKGTTLAFGDFGVRVAGDVAARITAKQLKSADAALKKKLKVLKGINVWLRVFPDIPVCVKVRCLPINHATEPLLKSPLSFKGERNPYGEGEGFIRILGMSVRAAFLSSVHVSRPTNRILPRKCPARPGDIRNWWGRPPRGDCAGWYVPQPLLTCLIVSPLRFSSVEDSICGTASSH